MSRRLWLALLFDHGLWAVGWVVVPYVSLATSGDFASSPLGEMLVVATSVSALMTGLYLLRGRRRFVKLLECGVVAPAKLVKRREARWTATEQTRRRVLTGWRREIESYDGPLLRLTLRIGLEGGPTAEFVREGGEWGGDLCLFDPARPKHYVPVEELPPFVDLSAEGGWAFVKTAVHPRGTPTDVANGIVATIFALALVVVAPVLLLTD